MDRKPRPGSSRSTSARSKDEREDTRDALNEVQYVRTSRKDHERRSRLDRDFWRVFNLTMEYTDEEAKYMSQPSETTERNEALKTLLGDDKVTIIDAFACVGGDSVSFLKSFRKCSLHAVQRATTEEEIQRCDRLRNNIVAASEPLEASGAEGNHQYVYPRSISEALKDIQVNAHGDPISLLYLDPPWFERGQKLDMESISILLNANVFIPIESTNLQPRHICMKLDFSADDLKTCTVFTGMMSKYELTKTINVMRHGQPVYFFHIYSVRDMPELSSLFKLADSKLNSILLQINHPTPHTNT